MYFYVDFLQHKVVNNCEVKAKIRNIFQNVLFQSQH